VTGDAHPEIFYVQPFSGVTALKFSSGALSLFWSNTAFSADSTHLAVAKMPSNNLVDWLLCALDIDTLRCYDAVTGSQQFSRFIAAGLGGLSSVAIERLYQNDPFGNDSYYTNNTTTMAPHTTITISYQ